MATNSLSRRDINVLEKIKDPESNPLTAVIVDASLPKDPNITNIKIYDDISQKERDVISAMQKFETQLANFQRHDSTAESVNETQDADLERHYSVAGLVKEYRQCVSRIGDIISEYPDYASARNNRAQALRRLHGDTMLFPGGHGPGGLQHDADAAERRQAAVLALSDLDKAIALLTPKSLFASISPQAGKTLALAHTQRAAIYYTTSKFFQTSKVADIRERKEATWTKIDFEEAASRDFALGGRYGNEIAKGLAVSTNPTAKLCGQMVREAMKKEYGPAYAT
ncbi:uncharacterized protein F4822DRAFT_259069 [Hypoxylon trugodes]|uniref:uncharacterized protein n=1 Tax=Hypoxylon trugodes TaxID=326681 RepID=UPI0021933471|nr:uncharacterized protein F4822DRAFT_259069 [Hypoxylon trugodes]KAI1388817.1 hypothetical protein F4822DRAFT_259069 [Hypoxylon trugodes]